MKVVVILVALAGLVAGVFLLRGYPTELLQSLTPENLEGFILQFGWWAPVVFVVVSFAGMLGFLSATLFTVVAGLLFGPLWGSVLDIIASCAAAQAAFLISRRLSRDRLEALMTVKGIGPTLSMVERRCRTDGFRNLVILRFLFVPYIPLSYAAGMVKSLSGRDFFLATLLTNCVVTPAFVYLGSSLFDGPKALLLPLVLVTLVLLIPRVVKKVIKH